MPWKRADFNGVAERLLAAAGMALAIGVLTLAIRHRGPWLAPFGMALGAWLIAGSLTEMIERCQLGRVPLAAALKRLVGLPGAAWGTALAHAGVGIVIIGIVGVPRREERIAVLKPGDTVSLAGLDIGYVGATPVHRSELHGGTRPFRHTPGRAGDHHARAGEARVPARPPGDERSRAAPVPDRRLYIVMGEGRSDGGRAVRIYFNPLASLICSARW
jgi:cytochrome c-type biogenesis protein CcmF